MINFFSIIFAINVYLFVKKWTFLIWSKGKQRSKSARWLISLLLWWISSSEPLMSSRPYISGGVALNLVIGLSAQSTTPPKQARNQPTVNTVWASDGRLALSLPLSSLSSYCKSQKLSLCVCWFVLPAMNLAAPHRQIAPSTWRRLFARRIGISLSAKGGNNYLCVSYLSALV